MGWRAFVAEYFWGIPMSMELVYNVSGPRSFIVLIGTDQG